jgi:hypothetical protein
MISILNFFFTILFYDKMNKIKSHLHIFWRNFKSETIWIKFSIFSSPKILPCFYLLFSFLFLACKYSFSYLSSSSHTLSHSFSSATTFGLPGRRAALRCIIHLWHYGVASPHLLSLFPSKNDHTPSPSLPHFHPLYPTPLKFHRRCLPPLNRSPSTALRPYKRSDESTPIIHRTPPRHQSLLLTLGTISPSEHHWLPLLSAVMWPSPQLPLQVAPLVITLMTSLSLSELSWWPPEPRCNCATPWSWVHLGPRVSHPVFRPKLNAFLYVCQDQVSHIKRQRVE